MIITVDGIKVTLDTNILSFQEDNLTATIITNIVDAPSGDYSYKLDLIYHDGTTNIIDLNVSGATGSVIVTAAMVPVNGKCSAQIRRIDNVGTGGSVMHTKIFQFWVKRSLINSDSYNPLPSEFLEFEERFNELANHPPRPNAGGEYWDLWNVNTHQYEISTIPLPSITGGVPEAPDDGKQYGRQNKSWTEITGGTSLDLSIVDGKLCVTWEEV